MRKMILTLAGACLLATPVMAQIVAPPDAPPPAGPDMRQRHKDDLLTKLSPEGRKIMEAEMSAGRQRMQASHEARKAVRDKVRAAMTAEPFSASTLSAAFAGERKLAQEQMANHHAHMVGVIGRLSSADRKIFADSMGQMEQRMKMFRQHGKDRQGPRSDMPPPPGN